MGNSGLKSFIREERPAAGIIAAIFFLFFNVSFLNPDGAVSLFIYEPVDLKAISVWFDFVITRYSN